MDADHIAHAFGCSPIDTDLQSDFVKRQPLDRFSKKMRKPQYAVELRHARSHACPQKMTTHATPFLPFMTGMKRLVKSSADANRSQQRSEEHTSELQSLMRISYAVFCLKKKTQ